MEIRVLLIGDVVGKPGRTYLKSVLPSLVQEKGVDFVIANGENAAQGSGITENLFRELIRSRDHVFAAIASSPHLGPDLLSSLRQSDKLMA